MVEISLIGPEHYPMNLTVQACKRRNTSIREARF
ncbi:hypothetical protein SNOG_10628 [Parastagonospora nodorum SN15]|uniref:Uncharacterized protein n=1 Tax=Phaeosphaeria nodorum (strain SN15 / ATCC MYA-4574 / FGSC 10173) TaxID=321614 RepID=Q0UC86_PHANO|nr:hypothetical protein SNOG_10628 [Parastagonospora nodorum SN15]EAT82022.1 hypothetical protein SNOG_10628 [Parastagonospora nodorum SN15]